MARPRSVRVDILLLGIGLVLAGCAPGALTPKNVDAPLVKGPPITDIDTPFDEALSCLDGRIQSQITFAVGQVVDNTGKEQFADGGTGKFVSQGAGDMVQSALFRAGVTLINRRDPNVAIVESNWGIRDLKHQIPVNFYVSGSINSLDFIPGGGVSVSVAGVGPRARQSRILIGIDLTMTDAYSGRIVASIPLQKQIYSSEVGVSGGRFFGPLLLELELGGMQREALHFALRQMLNLATFELLTQLMAANSYGECLDLISVLDGEIRNTNGSSARTRQSNGSALRRAAEGASKRIEEVVASEEKDRRQASSQEGDAAAGMGNSADAEPLPPLDVLTARATAGAGRALVAAEAAKSADSQEEAAINAERAHQFMLYAIQQLQNAATQGLSGPEGDSTAIIVEQAINAAQAVDALRNLDPGAAARPDGGNQ